MVWWWYACHGVWVCLCYGDASSPGKMTLRDVQLIEKLFFGWYSIVYLTRGTMNSYGPAR